MKIKRRILALLCLCVFLFSACAGEQDHGLDPNEPTTVTIWHYYNGIQQDTFDSMIIEFNETVGLEHGIVVEARSKGVVSELSDSVLAALRQEAGAEEAPSMFAAYAETAYTADRLGRVADLSKYFTDEELSEYVDGYVDEGRIDSDGGLKIFPTAKSTEVMMVNLTDWQAFADSYGVTTDMLSTWEGLAEVAKKYYDYTDALTPDVPNDGRAFFGRDSVANYMIVGAKQLGLEYFTADGDSFTMHEDKEALRKLWQCYYVPYVSGHFLSQARYRSDDCKTGAIIAMVCSTPGATYFPTSVTLDDEYTYPIEGLVLPVPNFEGTDPYVVQQGAGMVVVKSDEKTEYACSVFLKWLTEQERNTQFSANSGYLPVKKAANDFDVLAEAYAAAGNADNEALIDTVRIAVEEIDNYKMYAAKPFEKSAESRDFLDTFMQGTSQSAHDEAALRIENGEDREAVLSEYTSDAAFDIWYQDFISGLQAAVGK